MRDDVNDPDPGGTLFLGRCWALSRFNSAAACVAPFWPVEHRFFDFYRTIHTGGFGGRNVDQFSWFLRSPVPGVSVARLLRWVEAEVEESETTPVREVVDRALAHPDPTWSVGRWGIGPSVRTEAPGAPDEALRYEVRQLSPNQLEVVVPVGEEADHSVAVDATGRTATDHRLLRTSRGVSESICAGCHRALVLLEALKRSPLDDVPSWLGLGAPEPELREWLDGVRSPRSAAEFRNAGIGPRVASLFDSSRISAVDAKRWLDAGVEPSLAADFTRLGLDPGGLQRAAASASGYWWIRDLKRSLSGDS